MKFLIADFFSKCDLIRRKLQIWSHLLKKSLMENFIFCALTVEELSTGKKKAPWSVYTFLEYLLKHDSKEKGLRFDILVNSFAQDFLH